MFIKNIKLGKWCVKTPLNIGKLAKYVSLLVLLLVAVLFLAKALNSWFDVNRIVFHKAVEIEVHNPITIEKRKPVEVVSPLVQEILENNNLTNLNPVEQIILDVFGIQDFKTARAVAKCESGFRCNALNVNSNGTVDYGCFQINSIHWERFGGLENLVTCEQQIKAAYEIYKEQGFHPWVVAGGKCFVEELK